MKLPDRILLAIGLIVLFAALAAFAYGRMARFSGQIAVTVGGQEDIVVAPADVQLRHVAPGVVAGVPGVGVPYANPEVGRAVFGVHGNFHVTRLPFMISANGLQVLSQPEPVNSLIIDGPDGKHRVEAAPGQEAAICNTNYQIKGIDLWSGIVRNPSGIPMAAASIQGSSQDPVRIIIPSQEWRVLNNVAVHFAWHESEQAASVAADAGLDAVSSARWGIIDRGTVNWFQSFAPGAGATLSNGDSVTLLAVNQQASAIQVELDQKGVKSTVWISVNRQAQDVPVRFEDPARLDNVFLIDAWEESNGIVSMYAQGKLIGRQRTPAGGAAAIDEVQLRLDQVLEKALPLQKSESTIYAASLRAPGAPALVLRQGEAVRVGDCLVEFTREEAPPRLLANLTIDGQNLTIESGQTMRKGNWRLSLTHSPRFTDQVVLLNAELTPLRSAANFLFILGLLIFVWLGLRFSPLFPAAHLV